MFDLPGMGRKRVEILEKSNFNYKIKILPMVELYIMIENLHLQRHSIIDVN